MYLLSRDDLRRDPRWGVLAVCLVALALPLSFSAGAVAVPALAGRFQGAPSALAWVTNAFMLSFGSLLLAAGGLADRLGRRRLFLCGSAGFALATLAVCLAADLRALDLARGVQGVAAAAALASGSAALAQRFEGHARTRVFALMGTMFGLGLALGPLLAGLLLQTLGWRAVFASGGDGRLEPRCDHDFGASGRRWSWSGGRFCRDPINHRNQNRHADSGDPANHQRGHR